MSKFLFLDFDGVLHPTSCKEEELFCRSKLLQEAIASTDCQLVISSSWRHHHPIEELLNLLPDTIQNHVIGTTGPGLMGRWSRYKEIAEYLRDCPDSADWRALDDSAFEFPPGCPNLIACNPNTGMTERESVMLRGWILGRT